MPRRDTPVELISHRLTGHPLRYPVSERILLPLSSDAHALLHQFDEIPDRAVDWPPLPAKLALDVFPRDGYPPQLEAFQDANRLCDVFLPTKNKRFEWLGDSLVAVAIVHSAHRHVPDSDKRFTDDILSLLGAKTTLGHLSLLYGLQLHCPIAHNPRHDFPGVTSMSDIFEAFAGAAALEFGGERVLEWLMALFDPWVASLCTEGYGIVSEITPKVRERYERSTSRVPPGRLQPARWPGLNAHALAAFGPDRLGFVPSTPGHAQRELKSTPFGWPELDCRQVLIPRDYPPLPPAFNSDEDAQVLTAALTHVYCRLHFGLDICSDERYKWLGTYLCKAAITLFAVKQLSSNVTSPELDILRTECMNPILFAHLGRLFALDKFIYIIKDADDRERFPLGMSQLEAAFRALVGATYLQFGWKDLFRWLDPLLSPWIVAASRGQFNMSTAAESRRRHLVLQQERSANRQKSRNTPYRTQTRTVKNHAPLR